MRYSSNTTANLRSVSQCRGSIQTRGTPPTRGSEVPQTAVCQYPLRGCRITAKASTSVALRGTASLAEHRVALPVKRSVAWCCVRNRKSQAAMEFLMTYGWAILVVLAAIVALAYFGVLSPSRFLPESCTLPSTSGIACLDFTLASSSANIFLMNGGGRDIWVNSVELGSCSAVFNQAFPDGASHLFVLSGCDFGSAGQKTKLPFVVSYSDIVSNFTKSASGSITAALS